jgi:hypothetical protein
MAWETQSSYYSGQGVVLLGDRDVATGKGSNFIPVGNVSDLKISVATSTIEHKESQSGQRGIDLRLTTEIKANLSMTMENFVAANLAIALRGTATTVAGATVTGEAGKFAKGMVMPLAYIGVSAVTVKKAAATLVKYVAGTSTAVDGEWDYKLHEAAGSLMFAATPKTAGLVDGDALTIDYTYAAQKTVDALTEAATEKYVRFEGLNTADNNKAVVVEVFRLLTDPLKELSLISDNVQQFALEGTVLLDALQTGSKYFKQTLLS